MLLRLWPAQLRMYLLYSRSYSKTASLDRAMRDHALCIAVVTSNDDEDGTYTAWALQTAGYDERGRVASNLLLRAVIKSCLIDRDVLALTNIVPGYTARVDIGQLISNSNHSSVHASSHGCGAVATAYCLTLNGVRSPDDVDNINRRSRMSEPHPLAILRFYNILL